MLINDESPDGINLYLEEPSDNAGAVAEGQDSTVDLTEPLDTDEGIDTGEPAGPFYSYESDDGTKTDFNDAKELGDFIRQGSLRHADYTRKTQSLAEERKAYEANKAKFDAEYTHFLESKQQNDKIEKYLQSLPPEVFERLKQGIKGQPRKPARDPEVEKFMKQYEADKQEREAERQRQLDNEERERAFNNLSKVHEDFDRDSVMEMVKSLEEVPEEDRMRTFMEMLYYSQKGRMTPAEIERKMADNLAKKAKTPVPMGHTAKTPDKGRTSYADLNEARKAAMEELDSI
jgi:hypothetical protein